jgi:hypothetical protein
MTVQSREVTLNRQDVHFHINTRPQFHNNMLYGNNNLASTTHIHEKWRDFSRHVKLSKRI